jgi:hypothetical protein
MKKILLLLITLTSLINVSYASFPVTETHQTEIVESINTELPRNREGSPIWGILSILCLVSGLLVFLSPVSLLLYALSITFGVIGFNKKLNGLAIIGVILSILSFLLSLFAVFLFIVSGGGGN